MISRIAIPSGAQPWIIVYMVAERITESWLLTGGLMVQLHAIMGGLDVRPATDADLLGALILKSAAYQADHAGYGDRHLYDAAMLASLITDPDAETQRLHSHTDRRRTKLLYDMLTDESPYWNNLDEQHRRTGLDAIETLADW